MFRLIVIFPLIILSFTGCGKVDLYEKNAAIPGHDWKAGYKPTFTFEISDTTVDYQLLFVIRHREKYKYNNIWINLYAQPPGDSLRRVSFELQLATNERGWLATGMDDIYEHRIALTDISAFRSGKYTFQLEHIMRDDPLEHVMNVGIRLEKKQRR